MNKILTVAFKISIMLVVLISFSSCTSTGLKNLDSQSSNSDSQNCEITELQIEDKDMYAESPNKLYSNKFDVYYTSLSKNDDQKIVWVSTNPEVATAKVWIRGHLNKETETGNIFKAIGEISLLSKGLTEIYAQTPDGTVVSNKIWIICGEPPEGQNFIRSIELQDSDKVWVDSAEKEYEITANVKSPCDDRKYIQWIVSDSTIATVSPNTEQTDYFKYRATATVNFIKEGEIEIFAQTSDGTIVSNAVKIAYGNSYDKNAAIANDVSQYVFPKLKYNYITGEKADEIRTGFYKTWYGKERYPIKYEKYTKISKINCNDINIGENNVVTIKGMADTFSSTAVGIQCNFIIQLQYDENFHDYTVISEKYDVPELIRDSIQ